MKSNAIKQLNQKIGTYNWLKDIVESYEELINIINDEKDSFTIEAIKYSARGDIQEHRINPNRSIPSKYLNDGLTEVVKNIKKEMQQVELEIKEMASDL